MSSKSRIALFAAVASVAAAVSLNVIFERYPAGVTDNVINPDFSHQCLTLATEDFLDKNSRLNIAVWNIYKQQKSSWSSELQRLLDTSQLVLLQEASLTGKLTNFLKKQQLHVSMARAFSGFDTVNGVMNLSDVPAEKICAELTPEPIIRLSKSALVATYPLSNGEKLMVINLHSVNFSWELSVYHKQLEVLAQAIADHTGPVIMAGDFNTWRQGRMDMVIGVVDKLGLKEAEMIPDNRTKVFGHVLDHIFYRGLKLEWAKSETTKASDHSPLMAQFSLLFASKKTNGIVNERFRADA